MLELTDEELEALIGIDAEGNIDPAVVALALADAMDNPLLFGLLNAEVESGQ